MRLNECSVLLIEETGGRGCERRKGMGMGVCKRKVSKKREKCRVMQEPTCGGSVRIAGALRVVAIEKREMGKGLIADC